MVNYYITLIISCLLVILPIWVLVKLLSSGKVVVRKITSLNPSDECYRMGLFSLQGMVQVAGDWSKVVG